MDEARPSSRADKLIKIENAYGGYSGGVRYAERAGIGSAAAGAAGEARKIAQAGCGGKA